ncbi:MAG: metalloregulator ArsR/SmtB family transcription factor [Gallionella sp.]
MLEAPQVVAALAALAQSTRLAIYRLLVVSGSEGLPAGQIAERLQLAPATLSFHFKTLSHAGLIESRQEGRYIFYVANYSVMNEMLAYLTENCCAGAGESCGVQVSKC